MEKENEKETGISLSDILRVLWKNIILICIVTVLITVIGAIYTLCFTTPKYKASASVVVAVQSTSSSAKDGAVDYSSSLKVVETVGDFATSDAVAEDVNALYPELSVKTIQSNTSTTVSSTSYVVEISYTDTNQDRAWKVVNAIADNLIKECSTNSAMKMLNVTVGNLNAATSAPKSSPNTKLYILVSFVIGLVASCVVVFFKEFMSSKFKTKDEIETILEKDVLSLFPDVKSDKNQIIKSTPETVREFEPYNKLLSGIEYFNMGKDYKVIMFTSTGEDELKTSTVCNLAVTITNNEKTALIIDLDLRKPVVNKAFGVEKANGLVDYFIGNVTLDDIIKKTDKKVDIITAGDGILNPIVVLKNPMLQETIAKLKEKYDYILIDTPPVSAVSDALLITPMTDAVVFNVAMNQAKKKLAKEALKTLENAGANVIGINVTKAQITRNEYYYYYNSYYGDDDKKKKSDKENEKTAE